LRLSHVRPTSALLFAGDLEARFGSAGPG